MEQEIMEAETAEAVANLPAVRQANAIIERDELTVAELVGQSLKIKQVMDAAMKPGVHYGTIPGIQKPTLLKPGAETLNVLLRLAPSYRSEKTFHDGGHLTVITNCTLTHIPSGLIIAQGEGLCSTYESKYAYRTEGRTCPDCGKPAIIKGKAEYGGGWVCFKKKDGCGTKWADDTDQGRAFDGAETGRVDNPDLPDTWNTVLKMADKRALVAAVLNGTAASDVFTQDVEDSPAAVAAEEPAVVGFDPGRDLLDGALAGGDNFLDKLGERCKAIDATIDWGRLFSDYGKKDFEGGGKAAEFWRRVSNAVRKVTTENDLTVFPPDHDAAVQEAFAWAFDGVLVELHRKADEAHAELDSEAQAAAEGDAPLGSGPVPDDDDSIPFGDDAPGEAKA